MKYISKGLKSMKATRQRPRGLAWRTFKNYSWAFCQWPGPVPLPVEIQLEPSAQCNLKCRMCTLDKNIHGDKLLTRSNFDRLLENIGTLKTINFTGMGESLLNPNLEYFITRSKNKGISTNFVTNGQLLTAARVSSLIRAGLDKLSISIESVDPKIYQRIRGVPLSRLEENIKLLIQLVRPDRAKLKVGFNIVLLPENVSNIRELYAVVDFAAKYRVDFVSFQNLHDAMNGAMKAHFFPNHQKLARELNSLSHHAQLRQVEISVPSLEVKQNSCYYPWVYPFITSAGELLPCCVIPQFGAYQKIVDEFSWGNVFADKFTACWNANRARAFRTALHRDPNRYCRRCSKYLNIL